MMDNGCELIDVVIDGLEAFGSPLKSLIDDLTVSDGDGLALFVGADVHFGSTGEVYREATMSLVGESLSNGEKCIIVKGADGKSLLQEFYLKILPIIVSTTRNKESNNSGSNDKHGKQ